MELDSSYLAYYDDDLSFSFDENGNISEWSIWLREDYEEYEEDDGSGELYHYLRYSEIQSECSSERSGDDVLCMIITNAPFFLGSSGSASVNEPGVWVRCVVPEPSMIVLWSLMGVAGAGVGLWRKHYNK